jgi:hypothetical protein
MTTIQTEVHPLDTIHPNRQWIVLDPQGAGKGICFIGPFDSAGAAQSYMDANDGRGMLGLMHPA